MRDVRQVGVSPVAGWQNKLSILARPRTRVAGPRGYLHPGLSKPPIISDLVMRTKKLNDFWGWTKVLVTIVLVLRLDVAVAQTPTQELKRCLADFGGIELRLPYLPRIDIRSCTSPTTSFESGGKSTDGSRKLELIGDLSLGPDNTSLIRGEAQAAIQAATFTHFEALFIRHGYRRLKLEYGDARITFYRNTMLMLKGVSPVPENDAAEAPLPPIPFVKLARYVRTSSGQEITLTYKSEIKNTWSITIEGPPTVAHQGTSPP